MSATESNDNSTLTVVLGNEYDDELRLKLKDVLKELGVPSMVRLEMSSSDPDLEQWEGVVDGHRVLVEAETYIGLSISGPEEFLKKVQERLK